MNLRITITILLLALLPLTHDAQIFNVKNSALSDGQIVKLAISKSGVYSISKKNLEEYGFNTATLNPKNLSIFSNYGGIMPEAIAASYPDDFIEIPISISGEGDGKFNDNDVILFYAEGGDKWKYDDNTKDYRFSKNIYDNNNYVFLKLGSKDGKRINTSKVNETPSYSFNTFDNYQIVTEDKFNLLSLNPSTHGSGKLWVGEYLSNGQTKDFTSFFNLKNVVNNSIATVTVDVYARSSSSSKYTLKIGDKSYFDNANGVSIPGDNSTYATQAYISEKLAINANTKITGTYTASNSGDAWLDYLSLKTEENIHADGQYLIRKLALANNEIATLNGNNISGKKLWDVTSLADIAQYEVNGNSVNIKAGSVKNQYILFAENNAYSPIFVSKVPNQNLHGLESDELIIIYHPTFKDAAMKLLDHRIKHNKYIATAIDVNEIFNEFGSGKHDPSAIRNFAKMLYDRSTEFKYLLFFGDGSYDYKKIGKDIPDQNFIPAYETDESLDPINAFPVDDYYALLSNNDGGTLKGGLEILVGRLPVRNENEANVLVQKIIDYDTSPQRFGEWRLMNTFSADDEDGNTHLRDADDISEESFAKDPIFNQTKIYLDAYIQQNTPGGERYPDATNAINNQMNEGNVTWCYLGHGSPRRLAQESVVTLADIKSWTNYHQPALMITATCTFTGYDDPSLTSGGEEAILNVNGGAIALLTTTRPVYANENRRLTSSVFKAAFEKKNGKSSTFGEIILNAKNATYADSTSQNTRKFSLIGDPSQPISIPEHNISLITINGQPVDSFDESLGALDKLTLRGQVENYKKELLQDFDGEISVTIYDKRSTFKTLGNDPSSSERNFKLYKNIIFKGKAFVSKGTFTIECIIPKDINYTIGEARISFYATDYKTDAAGYYNRLLIGGESITGIKDEFPPTMKVFMNDAYFVSGGITHSSPNIYLQLQDDLGINISGNSIGHEITARLIGEDVEEEFILNSYYKAYANTYNSGEVTYPLKNLKPGLYTIEAKAWDVSNNSVEGSTQFRVVEPNEDNILKVYNYPNPTDGNTTFYFEHDLVGEEIDVTIQIFDLAGKLAKKFSKSQMATGFNSLSINWENGNNLGSDFVSGMYVYNVSIVGKKSGSTRNSGFAKMIRI